VIARSTLDAWRRDAAISRIRVSLCTILQYKQMYKGKGSPYSITERRVPELIPVLGSQPADDVSHKAGDRLSLLSSRQPLRGLLPILLLGEQRHNGCEQFA